MLYAVFLCALSYILGIVISPLVNLPYMLLFAFSTVISALIMKIFLKFRILPILIAILMFSFGSVRYNILTHNTLFEKFPDKFVEIEGTVCSIPQVSYSKYNYRYEVALNSVTYLGKSYETDAKILMNSKEDLAYGDLVTAWGFLTDFKSASNEFEPNYKLYYKSRGILSRLTALEINRTGTKKSFSPVFWAGKIKYRIYKNMEAALNSDDFAFANAMMFADKSRFEKPYRTLIARTGIFRMLCSPFSHISVIVIAVALLFAKKKRGNIFIAIMLVLYMLFATNTAIAIKAGLIALLTLLMRNYKGYTDRLTIISSVVFLLALINPLICFDGGFMMSSISSLLIYFSYKPIYNLLSKSRLLRKLHLARLLSLWIVLIFGTMPFSAYYFNGVSVYSVFMIPVLLPIIAAVFFLIPVMFIVNSPLTQLFMPLFRLLAAILRLFPYFVTKLPFNYIMLPTPSTLKILFYMLLWWVFIRAIKGKLKTVVTKILLSSMAGIFICIALDFSINSLGIYFINVGQGDAAVLHTSMGETVLIDGGGASDYEEHYNIGESVLLPYLISHGFTHIDIAIASHYHKDHIEGIIAAAEALKINTLVLPDCMPQNKFRKELEEIAEERHINIEYLRLGDEIHFRSGLTLSVIAPDRALVDKYNENDTSLVITADYGEFSALFTGDFESEENLLPPENIDVLKVGHHGSENANDFAFLQAVNPRLAIISVGAHNRYGLPSKKVISELENIGATVLRTDCLGDIRLKVDKKGNVRYNSLLGGKQYASKRR